MGHGARAHGILTHARGVLSCSQGDAIVLMSLHTSASYTLDEMGVRIWKAIGEGSTRADVIDKVMAECDLSGVHAFEEIDARIGRLLERDLVEVDACRRPARTGAASATASSPAPRVIAKAPSLPTVPSCVCLLAVVSVALRVVGLERVWRRAHGSTVRALQTPPRAYAGELARRVSVAASLCPFPTRRVEQSLVILWVLRRAGADAHLRFGVLPSPFAAHAWVEHDGVPVNDDADALKGYRPFPLVDIDPS